MEKQKDILNELKEQAPFLSNIKKENPFSVPENYFSALPDRVLGNVTKQEINVNRLAQLEIWLQSFVDSLFQPKYALTGSFAVALIVAGLYFYKPQPALQADHFQGFASLSNEEVNSYISNNLDEYELSAFNGQSSFSGSEFPTGNISNEELNNYIINNFDEQTLEEEFL